MKMESQDYNEGKEKRYILMRSITDIGMGLLWTSMGVFFFFLKHFSVEIAARYDESVTRVFGVICVIYGIFRVYRGISKKYLRER